MLSSPAVQTKLLSTNLHVVHYEQVEIACKRSTVVLLALYAILIGIIAQLKWGEAADSSSGSPMTCDDL